MTIPSTSGPAGSEEPSDPLERVAATLDALDALPLEQHPDAFAAIDEQLRGALDAPAPSSPSARAG